VRSEKKKHSNIAKARIICSFQNLDAAKFIEPIPKSDKTLFCADLTYRAKLHRRFRIFIVLQEN
jgi:hypothetical protein